MRNQRNQTTFRFARHALQLNIEGESVTLAVNDEMRAVFANMAQAMQEMSQQTDISDAALDTLCTDYLTRLLPQEKRAGILEFAQDARDKLELLCFLAHAYRGYNASRLHRLTRFNAKEQA